MAEELRIGGKVEAGVILLTVDFGQELLLKGAAHERLSQALTGRYQEIREREKERLKTTSCVVEIQSEIAGSSLVRALFELWKMELRVYRAGRIQIHNEGYVPNLLL